MKAVVYSGTRSVYQDMVAAAKSLLAHTKPDKVYFLIEDDDFPEDLPDVIETINVSGQQWFPENGPNYHNHWTYMVLLRAAYTKIFPDLDRILSLDIDTVVRKDISDLWKIDMDGRYIAGVPETKKSVGGRVYINFGVCMMNLSYLREGVDERIIRNLNREAHFASEQDAFNMICSGRILTLGSEWNACSYAEPCEDPRILHFAGIGEIYPWSGKRWQDDAAVSFYRELRWEDIL